MVKQYGSALLVSMTLSMIHLWLLENFWISGMVLLVLALGRAHGFLQWYQQSLDERKDAEMYYWMQTFLTTLSIKKTITETFVDVFQKYQLKNEKWIVAYASNDALNAMKNLGKRFTHPIYHLFLHTLAFYEQQGGDVFILFDSILQQTRQVEARRLEMTQLRKRYFFQWIFLWILNFMILIMSKIVLMDLFLSMQINILFVVLLSVIFVYFPLSHHWWFQQWKRLHGGMR